MQLLVTNYTAKRLQEELQILQECQRGEKWWKTASPCARAPLLGFSKNKKIEGKQCKSSESNSSAEAASQVLPSQARVSLPRAKKMCDRCINKDYKMTVRTAREIKRKEQQQSRTQDEVTKGREHLRWRTNWWSFSFLRSVRTNFGLGEIRKWVKSVSGRR